MGTVTFTVRDAAGHAVNRTVDVTVQQPAIVASVSLDKTAITAGASVRLTVAGSGYDTWQVTWGDGNTGIVHPSSPDTYADHVYAAAGSFTPTVVFARTSDGATVTKTAATITVTAPPPPPTGGNLGKLFGGISLPLAQPPDTDIDRIAADGFGWYRFDVPVKSVSPNRGTFNWSGLDPVFTHAAAKGLKVNAIIYMLPQWMNNSTDDKTGPVNNQDYADWCGAAAPHLYAMGVRSMELWNEQNHTGFWSPSPNRAKYVDMAIRAADAIHAAAPQMIVVSGGVSTADEQTAQTQGTYTSPYPGCHRTLDIYGFLGLFAHVDAVGIHPYLDDTDPSPNGGSNWCEWAGGAVRTTIAIVDKWAPGKKLPIWNTESACPLVRFDGSTITQTEKASRATHAFQAFTTWMLADGVTPMRTRLGPFFWFTYKYWLGGPQREATFGLVDTNYVSQPVRTAIMTELAKTVS